jgi:ubiquinone/menaquinone biosynthesis C-methylase UbiE
VWVCDKDKAVLPVYSKTYKMNRFHFSYEQTEQDRSSSHHPNRKQANYSSSWGSAAPPYKRKYQPERPARPSLPQLIYATPRSNRQLVQLYSHESLFYRGLLLDLVYKITRYTLQWSRQDVAQWFEQFFRENSCSSKRHKGELLEDSRYNPSSDAEEEDEEQCAEKQLLHSQTVEEPTSIVELTDSVVYFALQQLCWAKQSEKVAQQLETSNSIIKNSNEETATVIMDDSTPTSESDPTQIRERKITTASDDSPQSVALPPLVQLPPTEALVVLPLSPMLSPPKQPSQFAQLEHRCLKRVEEIRCLCPELFFNRYDNEKRDTKYQLLDFGGDTGDLTKAVALAAQIPKTQAVCLDVEENYTTRPRQQLHQDYVTYCTVKQSDLRLPFADNSFDCVLCLQSLHHALPVDERVCEIARILKPGGVVILREHDCIDNGRRMLIDIEHALWSTVIEPVEADAAVLEKQNNNSSNNHFDEIAIQEFLNRYQAHYLDKHQWSAMFSNARLHYQKQIQYPSINIPNNISNPTRYYYAVYRKSSGASESSYSIDRHRPPSTTPTPYSHNQYRHNDYGRQNYYNGNNNNNYKNKCAQSQSYDRHYEPSANRAHSNNHARYHQNDNTTRRSNDDRSPYANRYATNSNNHNHTSNDNNSNYANGYNQYNQDSQFYHDNNNYTNILHDVSHVKEPYVPTSPDCNPDS